MFKAIAATSPAEIAQQSPYSTTPPTVLPRERVPKQPRIAIAAASAANASGFLLVSLSKMPRLGLHVFAPILCAEAFPIKASDYAAAGESFNTAAFSQPASFTFGNESRTMFRAMSDS